MKFKVNEPKQEETNNELYDLFVDFVQFEINKVSDVSSALCYFDKNGNTACVFNLFV